VCPFDPLVRTHRVSCLSEIPEQQIQHLMYGSESLLKTVPSTREERAGNE